MILTQANFNRIKDNKEYQLSFNNCSTLEEFDKYIEDTLETTNINILINNIIKVMNIITEIEEENVQLEIKELILKANLSKNRENFKDTLTFLGKSSDERIVRINRIINKTLLENLDEKIDLLIQLEKLSEFFYPDFSDKLIMNNFEEVEEIETVEVEEIPNTQNDTEPVSKKKIVMFSTIIFILVGLFLYLFLI